MGSGVSKPIKKKVTTSPFQSPKTNLKKTDKDLDEQENELIDIDNDSEMYFEDEVQIKEYVKGEKVHVLQNHGARCFDDFPVTL